jgi:hypothetical protein
LTAGSPASEIIVSAIVTENTVVTSFKFSLLQAPSSTVEIIFSATAKFLFLAITGLFAAKIIIATTVAAGPLETTVETTI